MSKQTSGSPQACLARIIYAFAHSDTSSGQSTIVVSVGTISSGSYTGVGFGLGVGSGTPECSLMHVAAGTKSS